MGSFPETNLEKSKLSGEVAELEWRTDLRLRQRICQGPVTLREGSSTEHVPDLGSKSRWP